MGGEHSIKLPEVDDGYRIALEANVQAFEAQPAEWKEKAQGQFALFHQGKLVDVFASFDDAARTAIKRT